MNILILTLSFIFGAFWGSFFYTLALRFADGRIKKHPLKALFTRSKCPSCGMDINPLYMAPVIGYFILRGKCGRCGATISPLYPAIEIFYGFLAVLFAWNLGVTIYAFNAYLLVGIALCISIVDMKALIIPDSLVLAFVVLSLYPIVLNYNIKDNLFGMLALFLIFLVILLVFPGSFGGGDVKFGAAIGLLSGLEMSIVVLEVSLVCGAIIGAAYALKTKKSLKTKIPFAPFLTLGLIISLLYGRDILLVYYRILY
jgi:prepilin signal peptidase PulO-like enzyme (type II secretory pathway)